MKVYCTMQATFCRELWHNGTMERNAIMKPKSIWFMPIQDSTNSPSLHRWSAYASPSSRPSYLLNRTALQGTYQHRFSLQMELILAIIKSSKDTVQPPRRLSKHVSYQRGVLTTWHFPQAQPKDRIPVASKHVLCWICC